MQPARIRENLRGLNDRIRAIDEEREMLVELVRGYERLLAFMAQPGQGRDLPQAGVEPGPAPVSQSAEVEHDPLGRVEAQGSPQPPSQPGPVERALVKPLERGSDEVLAPAVTPGQASPPPLRAKESWGCPLCVQTFATKHGRDVHMGRAGHQTPAPLPVRVVAPVERRRPAQAMGWKPGDGIPAPTTVRAGGIGE